jgi:hypothetical protein
MQWHTITAWLLYNNTIIVAEYISVYFTIWPFKLFGLCELGAFISRSPHWLIIERNVNIQTITANYSILIYLHQRNSISPGLSNHTNVYIFKYIGSDIWETNNSNDTDIYTCFDIFLSTITGIKLWWPGSCFHLKIMHVGFIVALCCANKQLYLYFK